MKKIWKRGLAVLCATTMVVGSMHIPFGSVANAAETDPIQFGKTDTYLQMSNKLDATPEAVEATVNMTQAPKEWTLFETEDMKVIGSDGTNESATRFAVGTTDSNTPLGEGVKYFQFTEGTTTVHTNQTKLGIQQSWYDESDLAISFWCYNGGEAGDSLSDGGGQMRLSSYSADKDKNLLYKVMSDIILPNTGWNYIEIPLSEMGNANTEPTIGRFNVQNIQSFGFNNYHNDNGEERRFAEFKLIVLDKSVNWQAGHGFGTQVSLNEVPDITNGPSALNNFYKVDANASFTYKWWAGDTQWLNIDASAYELGELALGVWCYNGNTEQEPLAYDGVVIGVSNWEWGLDNKAIYTRMNQYTLNPGWNYVEIPLSIMQSGGEVAFSLNDLIRSMRINWGGSGINNTYVNQSEYTRYFTDFKLVVLDKERVEWQAGYGFGTQVSLNEVPDIANGPSASNNFYRMDENTSREYELFKKRDDGAQWLDIDASAYELSELALGVWCYNGNSVSEPFAYDDVVIGVSNWEWGLSQNGIHTQMKQYALNPGWNYVEIPLDIMQNKEGAPFSIDNRIRSMRITWSPSGGYLNGSEYARYFTDFKLVTRTVKEETVNTTTMKSNNMIFSNINATGENAPYGVYVTGEGYPAVLYGDKQYTLTSNIEGKNTKLSVVRDADGHIEFYLDDKFVAESESTTTALGKPETAYCIGADGAGKQIMNGTISDVKIYSDSTKEKCVADLPLTGDIQYVTASLDGLEYRGSRADDWIDYEMPSEIGDDYWSLVFVPDIQNLTNADDYNETWKTMAQWIADNVDDENIKHVIGAGDTTWNNTEEQYNRAMEGFDLFNNQVSWSNMVGNHDYDWNQTVRDSSMYRQYFGEMAITSTAAADTYAGCYQDPKGLTATENSYYRFNVNGVKWMILQLEYHPRMGAIRWADEIIKEYPYDNVILTTHGYINGWGQYLGEHMNYILNDEEGYISQTSAIWEELKDNENIKMILNGHSTNGTGAIVQTTETTNGGQNVPVLMINAQDTDAGEGQRDGDAYFTDKPLGMLSILRFSKDGKTAAVQYYSPTEGKSFNPTDALGNADSNNIKLQFDVETITSVVEEYTEFEAGTAPADVADYNEKGYVFAGWFKDEACTEPLNAKKWKLRNGIGTEVDASSVPDTENGPSGDVTYYKVDAGQSVTVMPNTKMNINTGDYKMKDLVLSFWYYNGDSNVTTLATGNEQLRISSNTDNLSGNALYKPMIDISVKYGWNHIELRLSDWPQAIMGDFSVKNIQTFGIDCQTYNNASSADCYFTDFELLVLEKEWKLGNGFGTQVDINAVPNRTNGPGTNETYYKVDKNSSIEYGWNNNNQFLQVDASDYELSELAIRFWCYNGNSEDEKLAFDGVAIGVSNDDWGLYTTGIQTPMQQYTLKPGWNYVEIPLDIMQNEQGAPFSIDERIQSFTITWGGSKLSNVYANDSAYARYFTDFKLVASTGQEPSKAYAKFVDAEVLSVKAQVRLDKVTDESEKVIGYKLPDDATDMRFVTTVDSKNYKQVGFEITAKAANGKDRTITVGSQYVYEKLYAVGKVGTEGAIPLSYTPSQKFSALSKWFKTFTVTGIPQGMYGEEFKVRPYWITMDGTTVYGEMQSKTVNGGMP